MSDPLEPIRILKKIVSDYMESLGLQLDEETFKLSTGNEHDSVEFKLNVLQEALITEADFDQQEFDRIFNEIVGEI